MREIDMYRINTRASSSFPKELSTKDSISCCATTSHNDQ